METNLNGDCYAAAGRYLTDCALRGDADGLVLVHGWPTGQGPIAGVKHGHAWCERRDVVLDFSNGRDICLPRVVYYAVGNILPDECKRYTWEEAQAHIQETGHWGPWK